MVDGVRVSLGREVFSSPQLREWLARKRPSNELHGVKIPPVLAAPLREAVKRFLETWVDDEDDEDDDLVEGLAEGLAEAKALSRLAIAPTVEVVNVGFGGSVERYQLYTDGGADAPNPGLAGWGCALYLLDPEDDTVRQTGASLARAMCHGELVATNGKMEWTGALKGLGMVPVGSECDVFFDATYVLNSIGRGPFTGTFTGWMRGWAREGWAERPNLSLIREVYDLILDLHAQGTKLTFHWVAANHKGGKAQKDPMADPAKNSYVDGLANKGKTKARE